MKRFMFGYGSKPPSSLSIQRTIENAYASTSVRRPSTMFSVVPTWFSSTDATRCMRFSAAALTAAMDASSVSVV